MKTLWKIMQDLANRCAPNELCTSKCTDRPISARNAAEIGMTLIEIMVVIVIIGVLGSALAYGVFGMLGEAREDTAKAQVATVGQVVESYEARNGEFPDSLEMLTEGKKAKLKVQNLKDPWQQPLQYSSSGEGFTLCSNGADKKPGGEDDICYGGK